MCAKSLADGKTVIFTDLRHIQCGYLDWLSPEGERRDVTHPPEPCVDAYSVPRMVARGVRLQAQKAHKSEPLPQGTGPSLNRIIFEDGIYRSWSLKVNHPSRQDLGACSSAVPLSVEICCVESRDGFEWSEVSRCPIEVPTRYRIKDRLWLWAHPAGSHTGYFSPPAVSRMTPVEAAYYLGLDNLLFIRYPDKPVESNIPRKEKSPMQIKDIVVKNYERRTIYHSPQTPGYTCWTYMWRMPDGNPMVTFTQATGPTEGRKRAPAEILRHMPNAQQKVAAYDFTGLNLENVYLHSTDGGKTWGKVGSEPFTSCMNGMLAGGILVLRDGSLLRNVWGQNLVYSDILPTGFLQRSTDGAKTWSKPEYISQDPKLQTWPKRLRQLRDGRLIMTGSTAPYEPDKWIWEEQFPNFRACLWVSKDPAGKSWAAPLYVAPKGVSTEEWDVAELDNGDLLAVFRTYDCRRCQSLLVKHGETWEPSPLQETRSFPHSGQPELLVTREGIILHIASNGIWWTVDRGTTWTKLDVPGSDYYPSAVQLNDGILLVVSHVGSDDPYGTVDQSIVLGTFRLVVSGQE